MSSADWRMLKVSSKITRNGNSVNPANRKSAVLVFDLRRLLMALAVLAAALVLPGCGGEVQAKLDEYLEELEFDAPLESVATVALGEHHPRSLYRISVAARRQRFMEDEGEPLWVQIKFKLFVVVVPGNETALLAARERHRGMIDDVIVTICRQITLEELDDIRRAVLKSRLIDALKPLLGEDRIQQLIFDDFEWEPI